MMLNGICIIFAECHVRRMAALISHLLEHHTRIQILMLVTECLLLAGEIRTTAEILEYYRPIYGEKQFGNSMLQRL